MNSRLLSLLSHHFSFFFFLIWCVLCQKHRPPNSNSISYFFSWDIEWKNETLNPSIALLFHLMCIINYQMVWNWQRIFVHCGMWHYGLGLGHNTTQHDKASSNMLSYHFSTSEKFQTTFTYFLSVSIIFEANIIFVFFFYLQKFWTMTPCTACTQ